MSEYLVKTVTGAIASFSDATPNLPLTDAKFPIAPATQSSGTPAPPGVTRNLYPGLHYETRTWPYKLTFINTDAALYSPNENEIQFWPVPLDYTSYNTWMGFEFAEDSFAYKISSLFEDQVRSISVTMFASYYSDVNLKFKLVSGDNEDVVTVPPQSSDQIRLKVHTTVPDLKILVLQENGQIGSFSITVKDLQIEAGEIATDYISSGISYKPFIINRGTNWMGDKLYINHSQKNMISFSSTDSRASYSGLSITVNSDGSIYVKGTATSNVKYIFTNSVIPILKNVSYYLSGAPESSSLNSYYLMLTDRNYTDNPIASDLGSGVSFSNNSNTVSKLAIYVKKNIEIDATFYPQLELGSVGTEYETWSGSKASITLPTLGPVDDGYITLDGKIKSNRILVLYDGSDDEEWVYDSEVGGYYISVPNAKNIDSDRLECRCDMGSYSSSGNEVGTVYITNDKRLYYIPPEVYNSIEKFKTFLEMFTITVNYETEKIEEVSTSYIPFTAFDGVNYLWCNNDETEVSYYVYKPSTSYKYLIQGSTLNGIADKLREKLGTQAPIEVNKFADEILKLEALPEAEEASF